MKEIGPSEARSAFLAAHEMGKVLAEYEVGMGENGEIWRRIQDRILGRMDIFTVAKIWASGQVTFQHPTKPNEQLGFFIYPNDRGQIIVDWRMIRSIDSKTKIRSIWGLEPFSWRGKPRVCLSREIFLSTSDEDYNLQKVAPFGPLDADILLSESTAIFDEPSAALGLEWKNGAEWKFIEKLDVPALLSRFPIPN